MIDVGDRIETDLEGTTVRGVVVARSHTLFEVRLDYRPRSYSFWHSEVRKLSILELLAEAAQ